MRRRRAATTSAPSRSPSPAGSPASALIPDSPPDRSTASSSSRSLVGVAYSVLLNRTRFGFDLRATGRSETAAVASGVNVKRMVVIAMLSPARSPAWSGMPQLLGERLHLQPRLPGRARLHRHRDRPARPQPPGRHRVRRAAVGLPRRRREPAADPRRRLQGDRDDHAGRRSCSPSSSPTSWSAATASRASSAGSAGELAAEPPAASPQEVAA